MAVVQFRHYSTTCLIDASEVTIYILAEVQKGDILSTVQLGSHRVTASAIQGPLRTDDVPFTAPELRGLNFTVKW
jgi:hypothetical protein